MGAMRVALVCRVCRIVTGAGSSHVGAPPSSIGYDGGGVTSRSGTASLSYSASRSENSTRVLR